MKILIAASECSPLVKVGGIADVIGSLPITLLHYGVDARVVIPLYKPLQEKIDSKVIDVQKELEIDIEFNGKQQKTEVYKTKIPNTSVTAYLIKNDELITNGGIYFSPKTMASPEDEIYRFAFFSKAVSKIFTYPDSIFVPNVIHCNDWHTGLVPQIIKSTHMHTSTGLPKTIFTIHNIAYQGFSKLDVADKLGIDISSSKALSWDAEDDNLDFMLQGIIGANYVTTVSEKYAKEIQTPEFGEGLDEVLKARGTHLVGILNGISYEIFDPAKDTNLTTNYSLANWETGKSENKKQLQEQMGLEINPDKPILGIISRLAYQKGLNLVSESIDKIIEMGYQVILLGTGDPYLENSFSEANNKYKGQYKANIEFSEELAMKIYAGSDMFLIPSRYEPSGLTQMIAMKYGTIPVVRGTGGLFDTVDDDINGYVYDKFDKNAMLSKLREAINTYSENPQKWTSLVENAMKRDFSWDVSAKKYIALFKKALSEN